MPIAKLSGRVAYAAGKRAVHLQKGKPYDDNEPIVKARPDLFEDPAEHQRRTARPTSTADLGERSMSARKMNVERNIEQATQAPGEKRDVKIPKEPPRRGRGSGRKAWADYAAKIGVDVPDDASRDDIIELVESNA